MVRPVEAVRVGATQIALEEDLPAEWLNNNFAMFWPQHGESDFSGVIQHGGVTIRFAAPLVMLAMKMLASVRGRRDTDDLDLCLHLREWKRSRTPSRSSKTSIATTTSLRKRSAS